MNLLSKITTHLSKARLHALGIPIVCLAMIASCLEDGKAAPDTEKVTPVAEANDPMSSNAKNFGVYIENSGSMFGYINGITEFKSTVYSLLSDLIAMNLSNKMSLNYINNTICNRKNEALPNDLNWFIRSVTPDAIKQTPCKTGTTDIPEILRQVLVQQKKGEISFFVSDCILSLQSGADIQSYLNFQRDAVKVHFAGKLDSLSDMAVWVLQYYSLFDGSYYPIKGSTFPLRVQRPYYIWFIGDQTDIIRLIQRLDFRNKDGFRNEVLFLNANNRSLKKKIDALAKTGKYTMVPPATNATFKSATPAKNPVSGVNALEFSISVNMIELEYLGDYLLKSENYVLPDGYTIQIKKMASTAVDYTHTFKFTRKPPIAKGVFSVKLKQKFPSWIAKSNSLDDTSIKTDSTEQKRTFGLESLLLGVNDAYKIKASSPHIANFTFTIQ